jgi:hypothetical protein
VSGPALPYRGAFGAARPASLQSLALPPARMPPRQGLRPLKSWRYVGVYGPELMLCIGAVRIGPARQAFWAVWDREAQRLHERTALGRGGVRLGYGRAEVRDDSVQIDLTLAETAGVETICRSGESYGWTRKQGGIPVAGTVLVGGARRELGDVRAVIDDSSAYYERHTVWQWSAGVGRTGDGREVAWNLVRGVNDPLVHSERTVFVDGAPHEAGPARFAADLSAVEFDGAGALQFTSEAVREADENKLLIRSRYRQPFGTFAGTLGPGLSLAEAYGVMEEHDVYW